MHSVCLCERSIKTPGGGLLSRTGIENSPIRPLSRVFLKVARPGDRCFLKKGDFNINMVKYRSTFKKRKDKFYASKPWRELRAKLLPGGTVCEICETVLASQIHHIRTPWDRKKPLSENPDPALAFDVNNLQAVCTQCHTDITKAKTGKLRCDYCGKKLEAPGAVCEWCESEKQIDAEDPDLEALRKSLSRS